MKIALNNKDIIMNRLVSLQLIRFIAAAVVVWCHVIDSTIRLGSPSGGAGVLYFENIGAAGVDIFFVLSGFIIVLSARRKSAGEFLSNRIVRVIPIYWVLTLPVILMDLFHGHIKIKELFVTLTFWPVLPGGFYFPYLAVGWTLCFEMLFYVGMSMVLISRKSIYILGAIFVVCASLNFVMSNAILQFIGNPIIIEFLLGIAIALITLRREISPRIGSMLMVVGLSWLAVIIVVGYGAIDDADKIVTGILSWQRLALWGVPSSLIVAGALGFERHVRQWKYAALLAILGDASYSTYLIHRTLITVVEDAIGSRWHLPMWTYVVALVVISHLAGLLIYLFLEKRLLSLTRRRISSEFAVPKP